MGMGKHKNLLGLWKSEGMANAELVWLSGRGARFEGRKD